MREGGGKGRSRVLQAPRGGGHFAVNGRCTPLVFHTLMKESLDAEIRLPAHRRRSGGDRAEVRWRSGGGQAACMRGRAVRCRGRDVKAVSRGVQEAQRLGGRAAGRRGGGAARRRGGGAAAHPE